MAVGEIFLAAFLQVLFDRLASPDLWSLARREGLNEKLEKLEKKLSTIEAVLADAGEKQLTDGAVKLWLDDLRDLAYDAEDVLDELATEVLRRKVMAGQQQVGKSKFKNLVPARFGGLSLSPVAVKLNMKMGSKIEDITNRVEEISRQRIQLGLENICRRSTSRCVDSWQRAPTTCLPNEPAIYGRDKEKKKIIDLLLMGGSSDVNLHVLPIVGMGGLGKTTLARLVYNDKAMEEFQVKAWICVSDEFDVMRVTKAILEAVTFQSCDLKELNDVQIKLREALAGKKFLVVLDDLWNKNYGLWEALKAPFMDGARGSAIVVTTRDAEVALMVGSIECCELKLLSDDDCWSLFLKHAFDNRDTVSVPNLEIIREKIVEKCKGLPLAARTLGSLLRFKQWGEWEDILDSKIWYLSDYKSDILPVLSLSYYHLPSHLKRCFAYCAIFPKDHEFEEKELVRLWMAEGFIKQLEGRKQMEELGSEYFQELLSRSIFQVSSSSRSLFIMHDLVNDLAKLVARDTCFQLEDYLGTNGRTTKRSRHASYSCGRYDSIQTFEAFHEVNCLRTFLPLPKGDKISYITNDVLLNLLPKLEKLRVLSLKGYKVTELPDSIGDLKHLRYLNLSRTKIRSLPYSACSLYNLQSLILRDCSRLKKLPSKMENLINLLHLDITNAYSLREMPVGIKELKQLQSLSDFVLCKDDGFRIKELMNLNFLRGTLCISNLHEVTGVGDAREANLDKKKYLDAVDLRWSAEFNSYRDAEIEKHVLDMLQPQQKLKELTIKCYAGNGFPAWLGDPSFCYIELLQLEDCQKCTHLPPLGQLSSLKVLSIKGMIGVKSIGPEFYGNIHSKAFPSLQTLSLKNMQAWEDWNASAIIEEVEIFPCLRELSIENCHNLSGKLPNHLPSLEKLMIQKCEKLVVSVLSLPKLCQLEIDGCEEVVCNSDMELRSLESMIFSNISKLTSLSGQFIQQLRKVKKLEIGHCEELNWSALPCCLVNWTLKDCERIQRLPQAFYSLTALSQLSVAGCPSLLSLSNTFLLSTACKLSISNCKNLHTLVDDETEVINLRNTSTYLLEDLNIESCPSLKCLSSRGLLPASLKYLKIKNCPQLESVAQTFHDNMSLKSIAIINCQNFKYLPDGLHNQCHLHWIGLTNCPSFISFPENGLPSANLRNLTIKYCEKLKALPTSMSNLTSLESLSIWNSPRIMFVPETECPTNVAKLYISDINVCKPLFEWGLHRLTSLKWLPIRHGYPNMESFPQEDMGMKLPTTLTRLWIEDFPSLKYLSSNCFQNLTSLEHLKIYNCPMLTSLPKEGLPPSLLQLCVTRCPLLKSRCKRNKGKDWSKIANVPCVKIDGKFIYDE